MLAFDLSEVILKSNIIADLLETGQTTETETNGEVWKRGAADVRNAELFGPVLVRRRGRLVKGTPVVANAKLVIHRRAENHHVRKDNVGLIDRYGRSGRIDKLRKFLTGVRH